MPRDRVTHYYGDDCPGGHLDEQHNAPVRGLHMRCTMCAGDYWTTVRIERDGQALIYFGCLVIGCAGKLAPVG